MKIIKTASGSQIKISKSEWISIGRTAGWVESGYKFVSPIDKERYTDLGDEGLEGPFRLENGRIVYYDPKEGKYYDRDSDMYLSHEEYAESNKPRDLREAKKKKEFEKSPKDHGFMDECMEKNKDKDDPGAYCASIVDKVKGTTKWRGEGKKKKSHCADTVKVALGNNMQLSTDQELDYIDNPKNINSIINVLDQVLSKEESDNFYNRWLDARIAYLSELEELLTIFKKAKGN